MPLYRANEALEHEQVSSDKELVDEAADHGTVILDGFPFRSCFLEGAGHDAVGVHGVKEIFGVVIEAKLVNVVPVAFAEV
jgi:hypothetical protein